MARLLPYLAAAGGGVLGALARWGVAEALPHRAGDWPWAVLVVNLTGCLLLGVLVTAVFARRTDSAWLRPFLGTGVLGGFTTFSTFAVDTLQLTDGGHAVLAVGYVAASVVGGVLAAVAGVALGRALPGATPARRTEAAAEQDVA